MEMISMLIKKRISFLLILASIFLAGVSSLRAQDEASLRSEATNLMSELQVAKALSIHRNRDFLNRRKIYKLSDRTRALIQNVLQNDAIDDAQEEAILSPVTDAFLELFLEVTSRFDDPSSLELMERARREGKDFSPEANRMMNRYGGRRSYTTTPSSSTAERLFKRVVEIGSAFGASALRDLSALTGIANKRDDGKTRIWRLPPPATPFIGEDAHIGRVANYMIKSLRKSVGNEVAQAKKSNGDMKRVLGYFQSVAIKLVNSEPMKYRGWNLASMVGVTLIVQWLAWNGVDPLVVLYGPTDAGAESAFWFIWQPLNILLVNARRVNSGMSVARRTRGMLKAVGLDPKTCAAGLADTSEAMR